MARWGVGADTLLGMLRVVRTSSCEAWSGKIYLRESEMNVRPGVRSPIRDQREKFLEKMKQGQILRAEQNKVKKK